MRGLAIHPGDRLMVGGGLTREVVEVYLTSTRREVILRRLRPYTRQMERINFDLLQRHIQGGLVQFHPKES